MQPVHTLNLKCPACGCVSAKTLTEIKAQKSFNCSCGFHADIQPQKIERPRSNPKKVAVPA